MTLSNVVADGRLASLKARHEKCKEEYRQLRLCLSATDAQLKAAKRRKLRAKDDVAAYEKELAAKAASQAPQKAIAANPDLLTIEVGGKTMLIDNSPDPASYEINTEDNGEPVLGPLQRRDATGNWVNVAA